MKKRATLAILLAACLVLVGCGGSAETPTLDEQTTGQEPTQAVSEKPFEGREARETSELDDFMEEALDLAQTRQTRAEEAGTEEAEVNETVASTFETANDSFRSGEYATARDAYEGILVEAPTHYGANVNLTLALLQLELNEEALVQALTCAALFPEDEGVPVNVQTAGVACGFSATRTLIVADRIIKEVTDGEVTAHSDALSVELEYNDLWDTIETSLYGADPLEQKGGGTYVSLVEDLEKLALNDPDDEDVQALQAYLEAVGVLLGQDTEP